MRAHGAVHRLGRMGWGLRPTVALSCLSQGEFCWYWEANLEALGIFHVFWNICKGGDAKSRPTVSHRAALGCYVCVIGLACKGCLPFPPQTHRLAVSHLWFVAVRQASVRYQYQPVAVFFLTSAGCLFGSALSRISYGFGRRVWGL